MKISAKIFGVQKPEKKETIPVSVRLTNDQLENVAELAENCEVDKITVLRWAVNAIVRHAEANGGRLLLPLNYDESFTAGKAEAVLEEPPLKSASASSVAKGKKNK